MDLYYDVIFQNFIEKNFKKSNDLDLLDMVYSSLFKLTHDSIREDLTSIYFANKGEYYLKELLIDSALVCADTLLRIKPNDKEIQSIFVELWVKKLNSDVFETVFNPFVNLWESHSFLKRG